MDPEVELIPRDAIRQEVDSPLFHGGLLQKNGGQMHMGRFGIGLAEAAVAHGAQVFEHTPMTGVARQAGGYRVTTPGGTLQADNGWLGQGPRARDRSAGFVAGWRGGQLIVVTAPLSETQCGRCYAAARLRHQSYRRPLLSPDPDNRLLFGGRARFAMSGGNRTPRAVRSAPGPGPTPFPRWPRSYRLRGVGWST
ncbi:NAD(P)/FAD-dependent oxidoreductase [Salinicola tamaricis]|uniref:NAD(P)/FAD-dependent oxidoreductase n=1 Tax=Salinicola tamaricis TaxID=1771309 RepID=UPI003BF541A3